MNRLKQFLGNLRTSFWFLPSLIVGSSIALALTLIEADLLGDKWLLARWPRLFGVSADGARGMLSTIAGSMMTVVGITFSMTLMTLVLASSQYTSRILRNFMRDRVTQVVLGIFAGVFIYCLIVLQAIRSRDAGGFVPALAASFGVVLALGGIGVLIFFIHHIASSIQASSIIASVAGETMAAVDRLFPGDLGQGLDCEDGDQAPPPVAGQEWQTVPAMGNGYIQSVDSAALLRLAREHKTIVRMERGVGQFVVENAPLASLALGEPPGKETTVAFQAAFRISRHRTLEQDCAFGIRQIVDMALRALSPSVNDTTTAVMCVDYLTAILARLASRDVPSSHRHEDGELRVIAVGQTFASLLAESFDQIRGSAAGNVGIMLRMLGALQTISSRTASASRRRALRQHAQWIADLAEITIVSPHDRARFAGRLASAREALDTAPVSSVPEERKNFHPLRPSV